jgi:hypothetical protein
VRNREREREEGRPVEMSEAQEVAVLDGIEKSSLPSNILKDKLFPRILKHVHEARGGQGQAINLLKTFLSLAMTEKQ